MKERDRERRWPSRTGTRLQWTETGIWGVWKPVVVVGEGEPRILEVSHSIFSSSPPM